MTIGMEVHTYMTTNTTRENGAVKFTCLDDDRNTRRFEVIYWNRPVSHQMPYLPKNLDQEYKTPR